MFVIQVKLGAQWTSISASDDESVGGDSFTSGDQLFSVHCWWVSWNLLRLTPDADLLIHSFDNSTVRIKQKLHAITCIIILKHEHGL